LDATIWSSESQLQEPKNNASVRLTTAPRSKGVLLRAEIAHAEVVMFSMDFLKSTVPAQPPSRRCGPMLSPSSTT
jgi:hypothetical protein